MGNFCNPLQHTLSRLNEPLELLSMEEACITGGGFSFEGFPEGPYIKLKYHTMEGIMGP